MCEALLEHPHLDTAVRAGDVFGLMIEHYCEKGNFEQVGILNLSTRLLALSCKSGQARLHVTEVVISH